MKTVADLVDRVSLSLIETGVDIAPSDVGYAISLFLEGLKGGSAVADEWLQTVADAAAAVKDEG